MPILAAEPSVYPDELFNGFSKAQTDRRWWAIYTKARQEKALARQLFRYEVPFFLPLVPKDNLIRGCKVRSHIPLFRGYVFLFGSEEERICSLTTNRISRILPVEDQAECEIMLARCYIHLKKNEDALELLSETLEREGIPDSAQKEILYRTAEAWERSNQPEKASETLLDLMSRFGPYRDSESRVSNLKGRKEQVKKPSRDQRISFI